MYKFVKATYRQGYVEVARRHFDEDEAIEIARSVVPEGWATDTGAELIDGIYWLVPAYVEAN